MRILAISHSCVTDVNQQLYVALSRMPGVQVELIVPAVWQSSYSATPQAAQRLPAVSFPIHALPIRRPGSVSLYHYSSGLAQAFRQARPEIVFMDEEPWSLSMAQVVRLCRGARVPLVSYTKQNILKRYPPLFRWIERSAYAAASAIAVISDEVSAVLRQKGYQGPCPILVHGCDLSLFSPRDAAERRSKLGLRGVVIGYLGRLVPEKGLDTLIEAARLLRDQEPAEPFTLLFVGAGAAETALRHQAEAVGLQDRCVFAGTVPHNEAGSYMNCMDIFALPSRTMPNWKEQFGRVIVEALACGVPVIGSDSGQIPHVIADTGGGVIFREGDAADLASRLRDLITAPAQRGALGAAGSETVRCRYTYDAVAAALHEILEHHRVR